MEWLIGGGPIMIPLLICSVLALAVIIESNQSTQEQNPETGNYTDHRGNTGTKIYLCNLKMRGDIHPFSNLLLRHPHK